MSATARRPDEHLSAFDRGQARLLRARLTDGTPSWITPLNRLRRVAVETARRRQKPPRKEDIDGIVRAWRALPTAGQLSLHMTRSTHEFAATDVRIIAERISNPERWGHDDIEPAIVIGAYKLLLSRTRCEYATEVLATISLHALGRRVSHRAKDTSDTAVLADIKRLAIAAPTLKEAGRFSLPLAEGHWLGEVCGFVDPTGERHENVAHARTYWRD